MCISHTMYYIIVMYIVRTFSVDIYIERMLSLYICRKHILYIIYILYMIQM